MEKSRILGIDAARGAAMILVCLSHFLLAISYATAREFDPGIIIIITAVASPAFVTISGITFGYLFAKARGNEARLRLRFIERAVLLLIPVHLLLLVPHFIGSDPGEDSLRVIEITDTIAIAMIANAFLIKMLGPAARLWFAAAVFIASWVVNLLWLPDATGALVIKDLLVRASWDRLSVLHGFAILPWTAVHLASTTVGERLAAAEGSSATSRLVPRLAIIGFAAMVLAAGAKIFDLWLRQTTPNPADSPLIVTVATLVSPFGKYPPAPGYIAFCGGAALIVIATVFGVIERGWLSRPLRGAAVLGRASLCVWVIQAWIFWGAVENLPVPPLALLPVYFLVTLAVICLAAYVWDTNGWNRHLTLGVGRPASPRQASGATSQS